MLAPEDEKLILEHCYKNDYETRTECMRLIGSLSFVSNYQDLPCPSLKTSPLRSFTDIQHVLLINSINQRKQRIQALYELKRFGWNPQWIKAFDYEPKKLGIICSHIKCLQLAKENNWDHVLVCGDDVMFRDNIVYVTKQVNTFLSRHSDWNVILFEATVVKGQYLDDASAHITKSWGAVCYIVRQEYYEVLIHNYQQAARNVFHRQQKSHMDNVWHSLQTRDRWYCILPLLSLPRPSETDQKLTLMQTLKKYCMNMNGYPEREQLRFNDYPFKVEIDFQRFEKEIPEIEQLLEPIVHQTIYQELNNSIPKRQTPLRCFQDIQHVLYINLDDRPDRQKEVDDELRRVGFLPQRVSGFRIPGNGLRGCNLSHIKCLEIAKKNQWTHVLICEDDALFRTDIKLVQDRISTFLQRHEDWDVITLGPNIREAEYIDDCTARVLKSWCAAAYIVRQEYYDVLLHTFKSATKGNIIADATWSHLSIRDHWYTVLPLMVVQRPSKSDLEDTVVDYRKLLIKHSFNNTRNYLPSERDKYINVEF
jgi:GR25 family glycosyltransferase involved in LPS biosynthesis